MVKSSLKSTEPGKKSGFPIPVSSYKMILIGFGIVLLGFILMMGGILDCILYLDNITSPF